ncbi:HDOD domain-containing protein [Massilia arenosa]|uniref:HDOD domain-containing protein n=1 Tax=Zemynaea arenosa TaxID=2561931 RepID=A0A4Y9S8G3_9BURK|nr:HDOD domain-containing protein [Massilia arenosa]TFW16036.1 HDOD domain-containing protein [Massilia arenosa]
MPVPAANFPLVEIQPIASARNEWTGLWTRVGSFDDASLTAVFSYPDVFAALAPLDLVLRVPSLDALTPPVFELLPRARVVLAVGAAELTQEGGAMRLSELEQRGYRVLVDVSQPGVVARDYRLYGQALNCRDGAPAEVSLLPLAGPHFAYNIPDQAAADACVAAGFAWLSGPYPCHPLPSVPPSDGTSRKRLLTLLALLARDADNDAIEKQLRQDPALSYHLLKLANSAAFAPAVRITSFNHALTLLGRRQLERWLQLLLYSRQNLDGPPNLLLPLAARRAAQMETLAKLRGADRDAQDRAFMTGVFSLLPVLLDMPMVEIVTELLLHVEVEAALLRREGPLGGLLALCETPAPVPAQLAELGIDGQHWWESQLRAYHWAIQVARNL